MAHLHKGCLKISYSQKALLYPLFILILLAAFTPQVEASNQPVNLRGVSIKESHPSDGLNKRLSALLFIPRQAINGTLYSVGKTAAFLSDPDFIEKVENILYLHKRDLAWFPTLEYASGTRPVYGGGLYYHHKGMKVLTRMSGHDSNYWRFNTKASYEEYTSYGRWKASLRTLFEVKDNYRFYGLGKDPQSDPRNQFISDTDSGTYTEDRRKIEWKLTFAPNQKSEISYLGYLQRRSFRNHGRGTNDFREVFKESSVPGFSNGAPVSQIYDEISFTLDTRDNQAMLSPGWRSELYSGIAVGIGENDSNLLRLGADLIAFIPTHKKGRLVVPRLVVDVVEDLNNTPIPFSEYPRQLTFRGVSSRDQIRSDKISLVPSLEYQWRLSHMFSGHLFYDHLVVGNKITSLGWKDSLWALGLGINFHYEGKEYGRIHLAGGTEGFQFKLTIGTPIAKNDRRDW